VCASAAVATPGCGASYQAVYEGEVRFEHCYRLDLESNMPLMQRKECWREWAAFYTYGQSRDRIEFAARRLRELGDEISNPGMAASAGDAGLHASPPAVVAPAPTSPFEAPPSVTSAARPDAGPEAAASASKPASSEDLFDVDPSHTPPGQMCMLLCGKAWHKCTSACPADKAKQCKTTCDIRFRGCVPRCLQ
jgi:hypothetical protein